MARTEKRTPKVEEVRLHVEGVAKHLIDKLYGPDGPAWGTRLTEIEDLFVAIREVLSETMLADALARQAAAQANDTTPYRTCPGCQQPLPCADTNERGVLAAPARGSHGATPLPPRRLITDRVVRPVAAGAGTDSGVSTGADPGPPHNPLRENQP